MIISLPLSCLGIENLSSTVDTVTADITNQQSLVDMCARTKVLVNCVGPVCQSEEKKVAFLSKDIFSIVSMVNLLFRLVFKHVHIMLIYLVNHK